MQTKLHISRLGGTALVAVLALSATPAFAQEVTPQTVPQSTTPAEPPAPTLATPPVTDTVATPTPDPLAAEPATEAAPATATKATAKSKPAAAKPVARSTATAAKSVAPAAVAAPAAATPAPLPDAAPIAPIAAAPPPVAEPAPQTVAQPPADDTLPIALGAGLGVLALGGAAFALRRRRRDVVEDEVIVDEPTISRQPAAPMTATPAIAERSAFAWGAPAAASAAASSSSGRTWVDRAHEGPTPENPFLNLKKRLQRAAFYDQRERAVAAGKAKPLSPMAGLPGRFAKAIKPKAAPAPSYGFSYATA